MFSSDVNASAALCSEHSGRSDLRGKQTWRSERKEMSAALENTARGKVVFAVEVGSRPVN